MALALSGCASSAEGEGATSAEGGGTASPAASASSEPTANGVVDLSAKKILARARKAASRADSVRVRATTAEGEPAIFDLLITDKGFEGSIPQPGIGALTVIRVGNTVYLRATDDIVAQYQGDRDARDLRGKWISIPAGAAGARLFAPYASTRTYFETLLADTDVSRVPPRDIDGVEAVGVRTPAATLWVVTSGEPYPIRLDQEGEDGASTTLSGWNEPAEISPPPAKDVVSG